MSSESLPITPTAFAAALKDLTIPSLYAKVSELRNSISHLERSNAELKQFLDSTPGGDAVCEEAVGENEEVIKRMLSRVDLVKAEVEARGQSWIELNGTDPRGETNDMEISAAAEDAEPTAGSPAIQGSGESLVSGQAADQPTERNGTLRQRSTATPTEERERQGDDEPEGIYL
ncbi:conserved hypothetical protein [Uncinocarpus reesii 1704]|uniref:Uncharacterized protein n=1 Tax=Uncinocarpus reesii (strain UAMH 1704) TaxID=336963 RepID=C4JTG2_UNCRE|nr:uncharacterized protein UREG_05751 [Uncinocarpus reesii 1704]EEP80909.1 conserved hypothetical protein [Uncinocarpus reesii 1704]